MKISRIWESSKNKYLVYVELDTGEILTLSPSFVRKSHFIENMEITAEEVERIRTEVIWPRVEKKALDYLSKRVYGIYELSQKLAEVGFLEKDIQPVLEKYIKLGYLNDAEFARCYVHDAMVLKRWPRQRIRFELQRKGIASSDIEVALFAFDGQEADNLNYLLEKKLRGIRADETEKIQKIKLQLLRKGFRAREIGAAIEAYFEQEESV